jgi:hypothetical protein
MIKNFTNMTTYPGPIHYWRDPTILMSQNDIYRHYLGPYGVEIAWGIVYLTTIIVFKILEISIVKGWWK